MMETTSVIEILCYWSIDLVYKHMVVCAEVTVRDYWYEANFFLFVNRNRNTNWNRKGVEVGGGGGGGVVLTVSFSKSSTPMQIVFFKLKFTWLKQPKLFFNSFDTVGHFL